MATRTGSLFFSLAASALAACIRIETLVVEQGSSDAANPSLVFDAPLPPIPQTLPVYRLKAQPPSSPAIRELIQKRCQATCTRDDKSSWTPPAVCKELMNVPAEPSTQGLQVAQVKSTRKPGVRDDSQAATSERMSCQLGDDYTVRIFPRFGEEPEQPPDGATDLTQERLRNARMFLQDSLSHNRLKQDFDFKIGDGRSLNRTVLRRDQSSLRETHDTTPPIMLFASAQRRVMDQYRVDGPGSQFSVMMTDSSSPEGLMLNWKKAVSDEKMRPAVDAAKLQAQISRQVRALHADSTVHVTNIELIYYDAGKDLLQPAFRYVAELSAGRQSLGHTEHIVGYVPYADTGEPIGQLAGAPAELLKQDENLPPLGGAAPGSRLTEASVGIYVVREDKAGWRSNALAFAYGLESSPLGAQLHQAQLLDATPEHFTTDYQKFINSVDVALVEAHGAPGVFATLRSSKALVRIGDTGRGFPETGYGPGAGGRLRHWAIHSCDVLAHPEQVPWHEVFKGGVQTIVGYRTPMYITDGANASFARYIGSGAPVIAAWFAAVNSLNVYQLDATTLFRCSGQEPIGRPAAISACGAENATVLDYVSAQADCLQVWTTHDSLDN